MGLNFSKQFLPIFLLIVLILVWTSVWFLFKIAIEAIPPLSFRVIIGIPAFALLLFLGFKKVKTVYVPKSDYKPLLLISFFNVTLWQVLMLYGIDMLGGGRAAVLTYTMPVWATIFASIFGYEKINISIIISLIFGMTGIIFLSLEINVFENMLGFLITLSAGLSWAIGTMIVKYGGIRSDGLIVAGWQQIIGIVPIIPFALYFDLDNFRAPDYEAALFKGIPMRLRWNPMVRGYMATGNYRIKYRGSSKPQYGYKRKGNYCLAEYADTFAIYPK